MRQLNHLSHKFCKAKKKVHDVKSTCENLLSNNMNKVQCKENAATKEEQTPHSDDENMNFAH